MILLTAKQAARLLGVHEFTIRRWRCRDGLPATMRMPLKRGAPARRFPIDPLIRHASLMGVRTRRLRRLATRYDEL